MTSVRYAAARATFHRVCQTDSLVAVDIPETLGNSDSGAQVRHLESPGHHVALDEPRRHDAPPERVLDLVVAQVGKAEVRKVDLPHRVGRIRRDAIRLDRHNPSDGHAVLGDSDGLATRGRSEYLRGLLVELTGGHAATCSGTYARRSPTLAKSGPVAVSCQYGRRFQMEGSGTGIHPGARGPAGHGSDSAGARDLAHRG